MPQGLRRHDAAMTVQISFIVPAYNEEALLGQTLLALHAAARAVGEPYELIVANDASTDATAAVALQHGAQVVNVAHRQIAATRNSGARAASGAWLVFVDADTLVNEEVLRAAMQALRTGVVGGGAHLRFDGPLQPGARLFIGAGVWLLRRARMAAGCFVFCQKQAFNAVGGFDETYFGAEELVLSQALKRRGRFVILRESVTTSGRKARTHTGLDLLRLTGRVLRHGRHALQGRQGMELWYGERRSDPATSAASPAHITSTYTSTNTTAAESPKADPSN